MLRPRNAMCEPRWLRIYQKALNNLEPDITTAKMRFWRFVKQKANAGIIMGDPLADGHEA